jgi:hypothetical protein
MRQWIDLAQPSVRCEDGNHSFFDGVLDLGHAQHEPSTGKSIGDEVRVLVHGQYRHPVSRFVREPEAKIEVTNGVRRRPSTRNNQQRSPAIRGCNLGEDCIEALWLSQQAATHLHDDNNSHWTL